MKKSLIICALCVIALSTLSCTSSNAQDTQKVETSQIEVGFDGVYFNTLNVMGEFEVGGSGHYVAYDDADAGLYDEVIRLTAQSYAKVCEAIDNHKELTGTLKAVCPYETVEYELEVEETQPMTTAHCAKEASSTQTNVNR